MKIPSLSTLSAVFLLTFGLLLSPGSAIAQQQPGEAAGQAQGAEPQAARPGTRALPPAYEGQLMRLSEILGALHYLRNLCDAKEGQLWRDEMQKLIAAEKPGEQSQAQMIAAFNRGFRGYAEIHRECNESAIEAANQFLAQGTRIAAEIPNRYGR